MKKLTLTVLLLTGVLVALMFAGCADYGSHEEVPPEPPVVCEKPEPPPVCEECETCEECQPLEDPCECINHRYEGSTEEEERCLTKFAVSHGMCEGDFDYKVYCKGPQGWWKGVKTWVRGCDPDQDHWTNH